MTRHTIGVVIVCLLFFVSCGEKEPQTFDEFLEAGKQAYAGQDYRLARDMLGKAYVLDASNPELLYHLGLSYARDFLYDSAYSYLRRADIFDPGNREVNLELYPIAVQLEQWTQAIKSCRVLINTGDPASKYHRDLAELHAMKEQYGFAYRYMRMELDKHPDDTTIYLELAELAKLWRNPELAVAILDTAIEKFGTTPELLMSQAGALNAAEQYEQAEALFRDLIRDGYDSPETQLSLAGTLIPQPSRKKKLEAYRIMSGLRDSISIGPKFDSLFMSLRDSLGISED